MGAGGLPQSSIEFASIDDIIYYFYNAGFFLPHNPSPLKLFVNLGPGSYTGVKQAQLLLDYFKWIYPQNVALGVTCFTMIDYIKLVKPAFFIDSFSQGRCLFANRMIQDHPEQWSVQLVSFEEMTLNLQQIIPTDALVYCYDDLLIQRICHESGEKILFTRKDLLTSFLQAVLENKDEYSGSEVNEGIYPFKIENEFKKTFFK